MNWFWLICIELEWSRTPTTVSRQRTLHCSDLICLSTPSCTDHVDKDGSRNCVMNSLIACDINASYLSMDNLNGSAPSPLQCTDAENLTYSFSKTDEHAQLMSIITISQSTEKTCHNNKKHKYKINKNQGYTSDGTDMIVKSVSAIAEPRDTVSSAHIVSAFAST